MKGSMGVALAICLSLVLMPRLAFADDGWYGSMEVGQAHYKGLLNIDGPFAYQYNDFQPIQPKDKSDAYRLAIGYQISPYLGFEAGYLSVGAARLASYGQDCFIGLGQIQCDGFYGYYTSIKTSGFVAEVTGTLPIGQDWALYARAGRYFDHSVLTVYGAPWFPQPTREQSNTQGTLTYGGGIEWLWSKDFTFKLTWDNYPHLGNSFDGFGPFIGGPSYTGQYGLGVLMFGLEYSIQ